MKALERFSGLVLPECDHQAVTYIVEIYDNQRKSVQDACLALMCELGRYEQMHEFIYTISIERGWDANLVYWDVKSNLALNRVEAARNRYRKNANLLSDAQMAELKDMLA